MRKSTVSVAVCLLLLAAAPNLASGAESDPPVQGGRVIRLVELLQDFQLVEEGAPGPSLGDRIVFTSNLLDAAGNRVGRNGADCVVVRIEPSEVPEEQQVVSCNVSVELADGQMTFQGLAQGLDNTFAVTGGTGAYRRARGEALVRDKVFLQEAEIEIRLVG
jgi:hypothetical protein